MVKMPHNTEIDQLISHSKSQKNLDDVVCEIADRIKRDGDMEFATVNYQLEILEQLTQSEFGRFLLINKGIDGYWTHQMVTYPLRNYAKKCERKLLPIEDFILKQAPTILATQQRFKIFLKENQKCVRSGAKLACVPCGMMGELLCLDYSKVKNCELIGIDLDANALRHAKSFAQEQKIEQKISLIRKNAWDMNFQNELDLISSNGLTIYEPDDDKVVRLYELFYRALKPGGRLVTSFLTPPPGYGEKCEWSFLRLNRKNLIKQLVVFKYIINAGWQCFRSTDKTKQLLIRAGFEGVKFKNDSARIFPTVIASK